MKHLSSSIAFAAALGAFASFPLTAAADTPVTVVTEAVRTEAKVLSVDMKTRTLVLKLASGEEAVLVADDSVKNLAQVNAGDTIAAEYKQTLAVKLKKSPGTRSTTESSGEASAKPGREPAGVRVKETNFVADVTDVDKASGTITVLGARGNVVKFQVDDQKILSEVKKGDQVEGNYVQSIAIAVVPSAPTKK